MKHTCHVPDCDTPVTPKTLMCAYHWRQVPALLKQAVWEHYRSGQERDKSPSREYIRAERAAIDSVRAKEKALMHKKGIIAPEGGEPVVHLNIPVPTKEEVEKIERIRQSRILIAVMRANRDFPEILYAKMGEAADMLEIWVNELEAE